MLNKILIMMLKYKSDKIANKNCKLCEYDCECYYCDLFFINKAIQAIIKCLKEGKI